MKLSSHTQLQHKLNDSGRRALRHLESAQRSLSTGKRINRAADDAAGLAVATSLRSMQRSLAQAQRNALDATSALQVTEQGVASLNNLVIRARELAVQASSEHLDAGSRAMLGREYAALLSEMDRIAKSTSFNKLKLIDTEATALGSLSFQIDASSQDSSRLEFALRSLALGSLGRTGEDDGAVLVSQAPLEPFTIEGQPEEARLELGAGPFTLSDTAQLQGTRTGSVTVSGAARLRGGAGPFTFSTQASILGTQQGPFTIEAPARILGRSRPGYDIVSGENDTLTLDVDGQTYTVRLETGYWSVNQISRRIQEQLPDIVSVDQDRLVLQATGPIGHVEVIGGTALATLGFEVGQSSTAHNGLRLATSSGTLEIYLASGQWTVDQMVDRINAVLPGLASNDGGRLRLTQDQPGAFVRILEGSAHEVLGLPQDAVARSNDRLRYRVGLDPWTTVNFGQGTLSAAEVAARINATTPGLAQVVGGELLLEVQGPEARLRLDSSEAAPVLGFSSGAYATSGSGLSLQVGDQVYRREIPAGTWTIDQIAGFYNELVPGVADVFNGRLRLQASGQQALLGTLDGTLNELLGLRLRDEASAPNLLKLKVGEQRLELRLDSAANSASGLVDALNAAMPGLARLEDGRAILVAQGADARIEVEDGSANAALGLTQGQVATAPLQGEDFVFFLNGEQRTVHLAPGSWRPQDVVLAINQVQTGLASLTGTGQLRLAPLSVGNTNTLTIGEGTSNARLGFAAGQSATGIDTDSLALTQINTVEGSRQAMDKLDRASEELLQFRAQIGAALNHSAQIAQVTAQRMEQHSAARARIEDADFARVTAQATRAQILQQMSASLTSAAKTLSMSIGALYGLITS